MAGASVGSASGDGVRAARKERLLGMALLIENAIKYGRSGGKVDDVPVLCRVDTLDEVDYYRNGGILNTVLRRMMVS